MRCSILVAAALPFAFAGPMVERSAATIQKSISTIVADIKTLNNTVNTLKAGSSGNLPIVLQIQSQNNDLNSAVDSATTTAKSSGNLNDDDSGNVANSVLALQDNINTLVQNLVNHKPIFDSIVFGKGSVSPQVKKDLQGQQASALKFGAALTPKLSGVYQQIAPIVIGQINDTFTQAIATFSNTSGVVPIPPIFPTN